MFFVGDKVRTISGMSSERLRDKYGTITEIKGGRIWVELKDLIKDSSDGIYYFYPDELIFDNIVRENQNRCTNCSAIIKQDKKLCCECYSDLKIYFG